MTFANPSYLWALAGLAIPLAIHLLSRKEGRVIRVGSLRHLEESNTSQFKTIRLNEFLLLLLRMLMIVLLAFFMSGAQCSGPSGSLKKLLYVESGVSSDQVDSLLSQGFEVNYIPKYTNYWSFAEELNKLPDEIVVVSFSKMENFKGERISLNENIKWVTAESKPREFQALAWSAGDSVFVRTATSNRMMTSYRTDIGVPDSIEIIKSQITPISTDNKIVIAALNVLKEQYGLPINFSDGQKILVTPGVGPLVERVSPNEIHINKSVDQDIALNENLVIELFKVLYPELQKPEVTKDARVLPDEFAWSDFLISSPPHLPTSSGIEKYLLLLFILSLAAERFVAIRRNQ